MEAVAACGLAAAVLQFLHVGSKTVIVCREIHQDGSMARNRNTGELTELLKKTTGQLEKDVRGVTETASNYTKDVIDVAKKCSDTATELLSELEKLQKEPKGGLRQSMKKGFRAVVKKKYLAETEEKLEEYREILNTRILSKLDFHAVQQLEYTDKLHENLSRLVDAMNEGRGSYEKLLANQILAIKNHIDLRLQTKADDEVLRRRYQQFKDSLFYPEIFSRRENISKSFEGTCRWIFGPQDDNSEISTDEPGSDIETLSRNSIHEAGDTSSVQSGSDIETLSSQEDSRAQNWRGFQDWLTTDSNEPYWLNGKPGSGKSTLMKYISLEIRKFYHGLSSTEDDLVVCSFFFWTLGGPLQKNYVGFMRSILYQIAQQREDLISVIMGPSDYSKPSDFTPMHEWTEQRLNDALGRFLASKPASLTVVMIIDGLDEFVGDEDSLMDLIRSLSRTSNTWICTSSRPEQIFRQGFATCPQLKLHELNYIDIEKATTKRLNPVLRDCFPDLIEKTDAVINALNTKSQGVFLWAELMTKDLMKGAREADTIEELWERLELTPDTIEGLYEHMLSRLNKAYRRESTHYFHHIITYQELFSRYPRSGNDSITLLEIACNEQKIWDRVLKKDYGYFESPDFHERCRRLETRILTRCAGLIEIDDICPLKFDLRIVTNYYYQCHQLTLRQDKGSLSGYLRNVRFIHKTAMEFWKSRIDISDDPQIRLTRNLWATRARIAAANLIPSLVAERGSAESPLKLFLGSVGDIMMTLWSFDGCSRTMRDAAIEIVAETYSLLASLNSRLNEPNCNIETFDDCLSFAAYFGRHDYVTRHMAEVNGALQLSVERIVTGALLGFRHGSVSNYGERERCKGVLKVLQDYTAQSEDLEIHAPKIFIDEYTAGHSKWTMFLVGIIQTWCSLRRSKGIESWDLSFLSDMLHLCIGVMKNFIDKFDHIDLNNIFELWVHQEDRDMIFGVHETLLSFLERGNQFEKDLTEELRAILKEHGAQYRRTFRIFRFFKQHPDERIFLTEEQSNRLQEGYCRGNFTMQGDWLARVVEETPWLTEPDPRSEEVIALLEKKSSPWR